MPTETDWATLKSNTGGELAGGFLKEEGTAHWVSPNTAATDEYDFTMLPGGFNNGVAYMGLGTAAYFWTSTSVSDEFAMYFYANAYDAMFQKFQADKKYAMSVRCIKN